MSNDRDKLPLVDAQAQPVQIQVQVQGGGQIQFQAQPFPAVAPAFEPIGTTSSTRGGNIQLQDGKGKEVPTHVEGSIRIRAIPQLSVNHLLIRQPIGENELLFAFQALNNLDNTYIDLIYES